MINKIKSKLITLTARAYRFKMKRDKAELPSTLIPEGAIENTRLFVDRKSMHEYIRDKYDPKVVAEVGVQYGVHACEMLRTMNIQELHLVDIWEDEKIMNMCREAVDAEAKRYGTIVHYHRCSSLDWLPDHAREVDYVYLDASHRYDPTKKELIMLAESATLFGGHDYNNGINYIYGVIPAVHEVLDQYDLSLEALTMEYKTGRSFLISKNNIKEILEDFESFALRVQTPNQ